MCTRASGGRKTKKGGGRVGPPLSHNRSALAGRSLCSLARPAHAPGRAPSTHTHTHTHTRPMAPPTLPTGDPRRPAEARPHPPGRRARGADPADSPDLRSMLATLLAVAAILGRVKAAAWGAAIVLLSAAVNLQGREAGPLISALPAVVFSFVAIYRPPASSGVGVAAGPREAFQALLGRLTGR